MPDYQKAKIYKLWSPQGEEDEVYFGSTIDELRKRKNHHKNTKGCRSKILFEKYDDVRIELLEEYPCDNRVQLNKKEGEYIRNNKCLNNNIPCRTKQEWFQDNKETISKLHKDYCENNKQKISVNKKQYYKNNKETILEKKKEYYLAKKEKNNI